jgi:hypothetical protein
VATVSLRRLRFLFSTIHHPEAEFYGRVGGALARRGHEVGQVAFSRHAARRLESRGVRAWCMPELMAAVPPADWRAEGDRVERQYETPSLRDVYRTDPPCYGKPEAHCVERTVRHFLALERVFDDFRPDVVVPEVGSETIRTAMHLVGLDRDATVLFLFYTIFPRPLRLYANTMHAPLVDPADVRELEPEERREVEAFIESFTRRAKPIRQYRDTSVTGEAARAFARNLGIWLREDRDNEYMRLFGTAVRRRAESARGIAARRLYRERRPGRPFVYFPLHVTDDYKIKRVIPHCVHQDAIIEQIADALPQGWDLVLKEHPMSIGRNELGMLARLRAIENVRLVDPYTSSHDLMQAAEAIAVISSTVGLEALMYGKPVMTLGQPFYAGYGVTLDVDSFRELHAKVQELLGFRPDMERILRFLHAGMRRCFAGRPYLVDSSDENAATLAASLDSAAREGVPSAAAPVPA